MLSRTALSETMGSLSPRNLGCLREPSLGSTFGAKNCTLLEEDGATAVAKLQTNPEPFKKKRPTSTITMAVAKTQIPNLVCIPSCWTERIQSNLQKKN